MSPPEIPTAADFPHSFSSRRGTQPDSSSSQADGTFRYQLFGLTLVSSNPLARLDPILDATSVRDAPGGDAHAGEELALRFDDPPSGIALRGDPAWQRIAPTGPRTDQEAPVVSLWRHQASGHYRYRYRDGAEFLLEASGKCVWVSHPEGMSNEDVCSYLLGPVFALVLRLRGTVCLHASATSAGDFAVAFLGSAHAGKSTLAAAFSLAGYPPLSDDIATLVPAADHFLVAADSPRLNLWPRSAELLFGDAAILPRLSDSWDKRYLEVPWDAGARERPCGQRLAALYELGLAGDDCAATRIIGLQGHQALVALIRYARAAVLLDSAHRPLELDLLADVVHAIPVRRVERVNDDRPQHVRDLILDDLASLGIEVSPTASRTPVVTVPDSAASDVQAGDTPVAVPSATAERDR